MTSLKKSRSWYENVYYCTNDECRFMQVETPISHSIIIPCPKCGGSYFTSREPEAKQHC